SCSSGAEPRPSIDPRNTDRSRQLGCHAPTATSPPGSRHTACTVRGPEPLTMQGGGTPMPAGSSKKRERQYEHIKDSYQDRGVSKGEAEERAARTVNKERRKSGETKKKS